MGNVISPIITLEMGSSCSQKGRQQELFQNYDWKSHGESYQEDNISKKQEKNWIQFGQNMDQWRGFEPPGSINHRVGCVEFC